MGCCKRKLLWLFITLQQDVSKVSLYNLGYICILLESFIYSEPNGVIFPL